ncbi:hypothetical protein GN156_37420, partial [bacterium LRH843]|nr:hypothetical protein [bacterium LRH843]
EPSQPPTDFGPNEWLVEELYRRYLDDPNSVDKAWWNFFADYKSASSAPAAGAGSSAASRPAEQAPAAESQQQETKQQER